MLEIAACVLTVALASTAVPASGGVEARQEPPTQHEPPGEAADPEETAQGEAEADAEDDTCRQPAGGSWIDWLQRNVYRSVCLTALWFDDLFGDERVGGEREGTWGRVSAGAAWDEHDELDGRFRLRVRLALPRMERRLHAVIGRDEPEREVAVGPGGGEWIPEAFRETDRDWLTGLEYKPVRGDRHDIDVGVGVRLSTPVDPYLRVRYRLQQPLASRWLLRHQVAPFWRNSTQLGLGTRTDFDHSLHQGLLLRLSTAAQITARSEGVEWQAGPTLFQRLGEGRAIAYRLIGEGTTDAPETSVYRLETLLRQRLHREWLVLELQPRLEWRHPVPEEPRELVPGFGVGVEMRFGDRGDR
ncbi:MAG TPA: hypothetical protein VNB06_14150, partial [Thermoanaerobaculia bacterium]|nr:hypothetical protein [Thermoanaerobaculia bacterium]